MEDRLQVKTWWGRGAAIAAAVLLCLATGSLVFDRNYDGVDDGGLDLCLGTAVAISLPEFPAHVAVGWTFPPVTPLRVSGTTPRSPPAIFLSCS
jgi:hypothetical protein